MGSNEMPDGRMQNTGKGKDFKRQERSRRDEGNIFSFKHEINCMKMIKINLFQSREVAKFTMNR